MRREVIATTDDPIALADELRFTDRLRLLETSGDVVDLILNGALLSLEQAAECFDKKIRKAYETTAATKRS